MNEKLIKETVGKMRDFSAESTLFAENGGKELPSRDAVTGILKDLRRILFPGYFPGSDDARALLARICENLREQVALALAFEGKTSDAESRAEEVRDLFCKKIPDIQRLLEKDVRATFDGDPAANGTYEIIVSYPGIVAIYIYRAAHVLYEEKVPMIPRMMTEYAHALTGIDINAGAKIGEYFVIDHGTGVVIGETTEIGNNVKIYQGVTLGALSTRKGQQLAGVKRHPTICNNVTIYSGASILGGDTVIGCGCIIGGNAFITSSVPPYTKVTVKPSEHIFKPEKQSPEAWEI